ncbi:YqaA family protein [Celerinatantimonas yamalensis]|uniref:YqaA family protein n=1 Tax=Celerinatantimonas yamalensis TaxID=559956 RepID=A0ABW9G7X7_9GAMM
MKIFTALYDWSLRWSQKKNAPFYLAAMSFIESIFWPIPVDVMLAPMALTQPKRAWQFALIATFFSVIGAVVGYYLGRYFYDLLEPVIQAVGYQHEMQLVEHWFTRWGVWIVFIAGFSPIPYKVFTISAGLLQMLFWPFILASLIGRGMRFFLVAGLMKWGGKRMEEKLRHYIDWLGWLVVAAVAIAVVVYYY